MYAHRRFAQLISLGTSLDGAQVRGEQGHQIFRNTARFVVKAGTGVDGSGRDQLAAVRRKDAVMERQADASELGRPKFNRQEVIVASRAPVVEVAFDHGKDDPLMLQFAEVFA
jgi:hypothetical protein